MFVHCVLMYFIDMFLHDASLPAVLREPHRVAGKHNPHLAKALHNIWVDEHR